METNVGYTEQDHLFKQGKPYESVIVRKQREIVIMILHNSLTYLAYHKNSTESSPSQPARTFLSTYQPLYNILQNLFLLQAQVLHQP